MADNEGIKRWIKIIEKGNEYYLQNYPVGKR